jgi:hypothetical protein
MKRRVLRPASGVEMERRIRMMLGLLPMSRDELRGQVVIHEEDSPLFEPAFRALRKAGAVVRDSHRAWFRAATQTIV